MMEKRIPPIFQPHLPVHSDLLNRVAWQLFTRASVGLEALYIYVWLPILEFESAAGHTASPSGYQRNLRRTPAKNAPRIGA